MAVVYLSSYNLQNVLCNSKDNRQFYEKFEMYKTNCKDCDQWYVGQTRISVKARFKNT